MLFKTLAVLALATTTLARAHHKRQHEHFRHHTGSGAMIRPTGGIWSMNSTGPFGTGVGASGVPDTAVAPASTATTLTVVPLPASSDVAVSSSPAAVAAVETSVASVETPVAAQVTAASSSCEGTTTTTSTNWFTVTVSPSAASVTAAAVGSSEASLATSVSLVQSSSVSAGAFFQQSSISFGGFPGAGSSAAVSVPTTFATSQVSSAAWSSSVAASVSVASSAATPSSTGSSGGSTGGKRGLSFNTASLTDAFQGDGMTWAYNWAAAPGGTLASGLEYVPMLWGLNSVSGWSSAASAAISSGSSHLLGFNEPDLSTQSNISPSDAATAHIANMNPFAGQAQIGSPAVTNGAGSSPPMGTTWLSQFFTACGGKCSVDFVPFHWYNDASQTADFMSHAQDVISTAQANGVSEVWITEFGATGTDAEVEAFLQTVLPWLDSQPMITRYAYFMCGTAAGQLVSGTSQSAIGEVYASAS